MKGHLSIKWVDHEREPQCKPDPAYPTGKDIDGRIDNGPACKTALPYPARRCGMYLIQCSSCGMRVAVTTAGRPDDPRSIQFNCKIQGTA
jgi:hypothetical protein